MKISSSIFKIHETQLENFSWSEFRFLTWGIPTEEWNRSAFSFRSVPIVHEAEIDSVNRAVEPIGLPIGLPIGRPTPVEKKDKFYVVVLKLPWTDDLKSAFIQEQCIKRNFVPGSGRSVGQIYLSIFLFMSPIYVSIYILICVHSYIFKHLYNSYYCKLTRRRSNLIAITVTTL